MKRLLTLVTLLCLLNLSIGEANMEGKDLFINQTYDGICTIWGSPVASFVNLHIWNTNEGELFAGAFESGTSESNLASYIYLSAEKEYISGTIPKENTAIRLLNQPREIFLHENAQVYDIGSGIYIPAQISADGYIVYYLEEEIKLFNCFTLSYENSFLFRIKNMLCN